MLILTIIISIFLTFYETCALRSSVLHYENDCTQLSHKSLIAILGQAFNPRYMSIEAPANEPEESTAANGNKRSSNDLEFYVDTNIISVGELPAWDTDHQSFYEKEKPNEMRSRRQTHNIFERMTNSKNDLFKARPWECMSQINWIDLGYQYFPRYIRSVECTTKKCWYGHFDCKPKSFAIKVLRRKPKSCIRINDKLIMVTAENYNNDYAELWIWQEIPIDFCCECVMYY